MGRRVVNEKWAAWWVLLYAATWLPHFYFKSGIIDPAFNLFIFLAFFQVYVLRFSERKIAALRCLRVCAIGACCKLTSRPAAILIAILAFGVYIVISKGLNGYKLKHLAATRLCTHTGCILARRYRGFKQWPRIRQVVCNRVCHLPGAPVQHRRCRIMVVRFIIILLCFCSAAFLLPCSFSSTAEENTVRQTKGISLGGCGYYFG